MASRKKRQAEVFDIPMKALCESGLEHLLSEESLMAGCAKLMEDIVLGEEVENVECFSEER